MRFIPDLSCIPLVLGGYGITDDLLEKAEQAAEAARGIVPVETGTLRDSITPEVVVENGVARGRVTADTDYAVFVEFGTEDTETYAFLRRGLDAVE